MRTLQNLAMEAQLDVPPLTLSLSPEYGGEGTRAGLRPTGPLHLPLADRPLPREWLLVTALKHEHQPHVRIRRPFPGRLPRGIRHDIRRLVPPGLVISPPVVQHRPAVIPAKPIRRPRRHPMRHRRKHEVRITPRRKVRPANRMRLPRRINHAAPLTYQSKRLIRPVVHAHRQPILHRNHTIFHRRHIDHRILVMPNMPPKFRRLHDVILVSRASAASQKRSHKNRTPANHRRILSQWARQEEPEEMLNAERLNAER
ncbi:MAG: hypothetical protein JWN24_90 [Phycisphaerales bacterium]|nr:hypothetical protein [Phycisphaerales bacterium]